MRQGPAAVIGLTETAGVLGNSVERHEHARNVRAHLRSPFVNKWSQVQGTEGALWSRRRRRGRRRFCWGWVCLIASPVLVNAAAAPVPGRGSPPRVGVSID